MKNNFEIRVSYELLDNTYINDEYLFRDIAMKMVKEMPMDELSKLIKFTKLDPRFHKPASNYEKERLHQLQSIESVLYSAEVDLP